MGFVRGAAAGFVATIPMTIAMEALRTVQNGEQFRRMPPREIVDRTVERAGVGHEVDRSERIALTTVAHFSFGAAAGALFGALAGRRPHRDRFTTIGAAVGYGLAVWAIAYGVVLPSLGLHPAASDDTTDRNITLVGSHVVWGATLGTLA